jgi:hypothetical protein
MALCFPDSDETRVIFSSAAEELFYNACREQLGPSWRVYHSCTLSTVERGEGQRDNEIDFVLYHPRFGAIVVEVKGGRIRYEAESRRFFSVNRHDEAFEIKNPFQQALVWKSRFLRFLRQRDVKLPVSHAVAFPNVGEEELPRTSAIDPALVLGRARIAGLEAALKQIATRAHEERYLQFADAAPVLDRILVGSGFTTKLYLRDYLDSHELRVRDVETIHETLITPIAGSRRLGVEGEAGTGKTMLAVMLARHFRDQGRSVLLLSSNALLNAYLKNEAGSGVDVHTYGELADSFGVDLMQPPRDYAGKREDWVQYEAPDRLRRAVAAAARRYEILLCDEAQDVQPFWWEALETLLAQSDESRFYVFFDRSQGVFGSGGESRHFVPEETLPVGAPYFPLVHNYRTTREIATFARAFRTGKAILQSHCGRLGYVPELITYTDAADCRGLLAKLFRRLFREEALDPAEVTLLSARNPVAKESVLAGADEIARFPLRALGENPSRPVARGEVAVATVASFKGLEAPVAVLLNLSEYNLPADHPIMASLIYVACTRAKHMLYIMVQKDDPKRQVLEAALAAIRASGTMVLEGSSADYEFVGTVTHYNPNRVGWLSVEDPAFQKSSVMFFPHDVARAGLPALRTGTRVRFRPRVEGHATIATDLRPASGGQVEASRLQDAA